MNKDLITVCVSVIIVVCTAIIGAIIYNINDRNNMAKNIEAAIAKGVDPLSVKCAYAVLCFRPGTILALYGIPLSQSHITF